MYIGQVPHLEFPESRIQLLSKIMRTNRKLAVWEAAFGLLAILAWVGTASAQANQAEDYVGKITRGRHFETPIVWVGQTPPGQQESKALWQALDVGQSKDFSQMVVNLEAFVEKHTNSPWSPSIHADLGQYYLREGYLSLALSHWRLGWEATKNLADSQGRQVADSCLVNLLRLFSSLGRVNELGLLLEQNKDRAFSGIGQNLYNQSEQAYKTMLAFPEYAYRCGTYALNAVATVITGERFIPSIREQPSPGTGFSMATLQRLAQQNKLDLVAVRRTNGKDLIVPSVVHWKQNHYAAITGRNGDRYRVVDPTFELDKWLTADAINYECSGEFMIPRPHCDLVGSD